MDKEAGFVDIHFADSPFSLMADERYAGCWSGRKKVHAVLLQMRQSLVKVPDSSLEIMWARFGAGKTHTLYHLAHLLQTGSASSQNICVVVEMPEQIRKFLDFYRRIALVLPLDRVAQLIPPKSLAGVPDALTRAGAVVRAGGSYERDIVITWLTGGRPGLRELRQCSGITHRIEDDLTATDVLSGIVRVLAHRRVRLSILVDEFQRVGVLKDNHRAAILSCIRSIFTRNPSHFSVLASIQSMVERSALEFIPPELKTLLGRKPAISLPEMDEAEAKEFLLGRFICFRPPGYQGPETAPFMPEAIEEGIHFLGSEAEVLLGPREILQAFGYVYSRADESPGGITPDETLRVLRSVYASETQK